MLYCILLIIHSEKFLVVKPSAEPQKVFGNENKIVKY